MLGRIRFHGVVAPAVGLLVVLPALAAASPWRPNLGVEGGPNLGRLNSTNSFGEQHWNLGGSAGLVARWRLAGSWSVEAVPGWERPVARTTAEWDMSVTTPFGNSVEHYRIEQTFRFDRVAIPIKAVFHPGGSSWFLEGGLTPSWIARASSEQVFGMTSTSSSTIGPALAARRRATPSANIFESVGTFDSPNWKAMFDRWDTAAVLGVGWEHPLGLHVVRLGARWQQGLTDISKFDPVVRVSSASATVGVLW